MEVLLYFTGAIFKTLVWICVPCRVWRGTVVVRESILGGGDVSMRLLEVGQTCAAQAVGGAQRNRVPTTAASVVATADADAVEAADSALLTQRVVPRAWGQCVAAAPGATLRWYW